MTFKVAHDHRGPSGEHTSSYPHLRVTVDLSCTVSEIQRRIGGKSVIFSTSCVFNAPLRVARWYFITRLVLENL